MRLIVQLQASGAEVVAELVADELLLAAVVDRVARLHQDDALLVIHNVQSFAHQTGIHAGVSSVDLEATQIGSLILRRSSCRFGDLAHPLGGGVVDVVGPFPTLRVDRLAP